MPPALPPRLDPQQLEALELIEEARRALWRAFLRLECGPAEAIAGEMWFATKAGRDKALTALGIPPEQWPAVHEAARLAA